MPAPLTRRAVCQLLAAQAASATLAPGPSAPHQPNVLTILLDDVGYGDLSCLGNPVIRTPHLDRLHDRSVRFTNFHVSPTCSPTRASLMTGRYCNATGVWHTIMGRSLLDPQEVTLPECFRASGYRTGLFGKWHLGDNYPCRAQDKGFDEVVAIGGGGLWQTPDFFGNDDFDGTYLHNGQWQKYPGFSTDVWCNEAMRFMATAQTQNKPFFCWLATSAAHEPTWAKDADEAPYRGVTGLTQPGFYGMIANADQNIGRLLAFLDKQHLTDNTILLFMTDNGGLDGVRVFNASMRGTKGSPYDGGHRVPCFVSWPAGNLQPPRDVAQLTAHIDLLPTLADLCRLPERGRNVHGKSLRLLLTTPDASRSERTLFTDSQRQETLLKWRNTAVMTQQWRLVNVAKDGAPPKPELYDIAKDPGQQNDLAATLPAVVQRLSAEYDHWWASTTARGDRLVRIVLGDPAENPACLTAMDWHGDAEKVWNQRQIRTGPATNGVWAVHVSRAGRYRFELRRWPREVNLPISAPYTDPRPNREKTPGAAIPIISARLNVGPIAVAKTVAATDTFAEFMLDLLSGPAELRTIFYDDSHTPRGSYYLYVQRL